MLTAMRLWQQHPNSNKIVGKMPRSVTAPVVINGKTHSSSDVRQFILMKTNWRLTTVRNYSYQLRQEIVKGTTIIHTNNACIKVIAFCSRSVWQRKFHAEISNWASAFVCTKTLERICQICIKIFTMRHKMCHFMTLQHCLNKVCQQHVQRRYSFRPLK